MTWQLYLNMSPDSAVGGAGGFVIPCCQNCRRCKWIVVVFKENGWYLHLKVTLNFENALFQGLR